MTTYKRGAVECQRAGTSLPPWAPQQEAEQVENKHGGSGEGAEEGFVVVLLLEDVLEREDTQRFPAPSLTDKTNTCNIPPGVLQNISSCSLVQQ